jgi:hypothetical protein
MRRFPRRRLHLTARAASVVERRGAVNAAEPSSPAVSAPGRCCQAQGRSDTCSSPCARREDDRARLEWRLMHTVELHRGACRCGRGEFIARYVTSDRPGAELEGWELAVACDVCRRQFELVRQDGDIVAVCRSAWEARQEADRAALRRARTLLESEPGQAALSEAERRLAALSSNAMSEATHSFVSVPHVPPRPEDVRVWLQRVVGAPNLVALLTWLGSPDPDFEREARAIRALWEEGCTALPTNGPRLCPERPRWIAP